MVDSTPDKPTVFRNIECTVDRTRRENDGFRKNCCPIPKGQFKEVFSGTYDPITAMGHKDEVNLLQQLADKAFITPTAFGQFLNETYNQTIEEAAHSKAKLVESVKVQLAANYQKQIDNLNEKLKGVEGTEKRRRKATA